MTIKPVLVYRNSDSTLDLNSRAARILDRGIFDGGHLSPSGLALTMDIAPFIAVGWDGMVAISDDSETLSIPGPAAAGPSRVSYLILHLEYRSLTSAIANLQVVPESTYTTSISREFFITFARIEVPFGATSLQDPGVVVDYAAGDWAEKAGKAGWRSPVADFASLPTYTASGPNLGNRDGDVRLALDTLTPYAWDAGTDAWNPIGGALDLSETVSRNNETEDQILRSFNGSGVISSTDNDFISFAGLGGFSHRGRANLGVLTTIDLSLTTPDRLDLASMHAVLNGHFLKTPYTELTFSPPAAGRYDLVFLEAWREALPGSVDSETYPNDPTVGGTSTFAQLRDNLEQLLEQVTSPNIGFSKIELYDSSTYVATRWRLAIQDGVPAGVLADSSLAAPVTLNVDGNAFSLAGAQTDQRLWSAPSVTSVDGISWAIPLILVRRTLSEGAGAYLQRTRPDDNNDRYIFDVAPRAELGTGIGELAFATSVNSTASSGIDSQKLASGFTNGLQRPLAPNPGGIRIPEGQISVLGQKLTGLTNNVALPAAPAAGQRRDLVVIEVQATAHPPGNVVYSGNLQLNRYNRTGLRTAQWAGRPQVFDVGTDLDTTDAMTTAGYSPFPGDPGLWFRNSLPHEDPGPIGGPGQVYAIPVALVHRRNTAPFAVIGNQNGTTGRPDGITDPSTPALKEILDLRHRVVQSEAEAADIMKDSLDKLYRGELRTRMKAAPFSGNSAGIQNLHIDSISSILGAGTHSVQPFPEGSTTFWGDSDEAVLLTATFPQWNTGGAVTDGSTTPTFTWSGTATQGFLTINAPPGYVLNISPTLGGSAALGPGAVTIATATVATGATDVPREASFAAGSVTVDAEGNATQLASGFSPIALPAGADPNGQVHVQVWARRPARGAGAPYANNRGLYEVPDLVHRIEFFDGVNTFEADTAPIVAQITATPVADAVTITQADLFAALGGAGNRYATALTDLNMYGILDVQIQGASVFLGSGLPKVRYVDLTDAGATGPGFERIRVEFSPGSVAVPVTFTVAFDGDLINRWAIVTPMNRGIRALYSWHATPVTTGSLSVSAASAIQPTRGATGLPSRNFMVPLRDGGYQGGALGVTSGDFDTNVSWSFSPDAILYARNVTVSSPQWRLWSDPADRDATNVGLANSYYYGTVELPQQSYQTSGYSAFASAGYDFYPGHDIEYLVVSPCRVPLTNSQTLTVFYDATPYQGLSDAYPLQEKTTGTVVEVGDATVHTMGTNMPWISPRALSFDNSGRVLADLDAGSKYSEGQDLGALQRIHQATNPGRSSATFDGPQPRKPIGALTRRLPMAGEAFGLSNIETVFSNTIIGPEPLTKVRVVRAEEASGENVSVFIGMDYNIGSWVTNTSGEFVYFPVIAPTGAQIQSIDVRAGVTGGPSASLNLALINKNTPAPPATFSDSITVSTDNERQLHSAIEGQYFTVQENSGQVLRIISGTAAVDTNVYDVRVYYTVPWLSGDQYGRLARFPYPGQGAANSPHLHKGAVLENPWAPADFAALEAEFFTDGDTTYGSVPRGRVAIANADLGASTFPLTFGALLYYVPLSNLDSSIVNGTDFLPTFSAALSWPLASSPRSLDLPRSYAGERYRLFAANSPDNAPNTSVGGAGTILPYMIKDNDGALNMVVSHSSTLIRSTTSSVVSASIGALASIDAFYPVGRPVYIKE